MEFTIEETILTQSLGYDPAVCEVVKEAAKKPLEQVILTQWAEETETWVQRPGNALSTLMSRDKAEAFVRANQATLNAKGYSAYASERKDGRGMSAGEELILLKSVDPYDIIRLRETYGWEEADSNLSSDDIIDRLKKWDALCGVTLLGAGADWISLDFKSVPEDLSSFAFDVFYFCSEGIGDWYEDDGDENGRPLWYQQVDADYPQRIDAAYATPKGSIDPERGEADEKRAKLVALGLMSERYRFFWWD